MLTYFRCIYIGDGREDGFVRGHSYTLQLTQGWFGSKIRAIPTHGATHKLYVDYSTYYNNLEHFLLNWKFVEFERESLWDNKIRTQQPDL